jgi:hypothetical protein
MKVLGGAITTLVIAVGLASPGLVSPAPASARATSCATHWGSKPRRVGHLVESAVQQVRAGRHACFDRLVITVGSGARAGYRVQYVRRIIQDSSGKVIHVRGRAKLRITILAPAASGFPVNGRHLAAVAGFRTFRQVVGAGSFEGITSLGLGVRARLPFRVELLAGPGHQHRLVIDVAQHW